MINHTCAHVPAVWWKHSWKVWARVAHNECCDFCWLQAWWNNLNNTIYGDAIDAVNGSVRHSDGNFQSPCPITYCKCIWQNNWAAYAMAAAFRNVRVFKHRPMYVTNVLFTVSHNEMWSINNVKYFLHVNKSHTIHGPNRSPSTTHSTYRLSVCVWCPFGVILTSEHEHREAINISPSTTYNNCVYCVRLYRYMGYRVPSHMNSTNRQFIQMSTNPACGPELIIINGNTRMIFRADVRVGCIAVAHINHIRVAAVWQSAGRNAFELSADLSEFPTKKKYNKHAHS